MNILITTGIYPPDVGGPAKFVPLISKHLSNENEEVLKTAILTQVTQVIGSIAKPDKIQVVSGLPKTRSGKIMRRILRKVASGDASNLGDTSTLLDPSVVDKIKQGAIQ